MESPPAGPARTLIMTRAGAIGVAIGLVCTAFVCGCFFSALYIETSAKHRLATLEVQYANDVKRVLEHAFVPVFIDAAGDEVGLRDFRPSRDDSVTWSLVGIHGKDRHIDISGDGSVFVSDATGEKLVATLDEAYCSDFFRKVIAGGLAGSSEDLLILKRDLAFKSGLEQLQFMPGGDEQSRRIRISIPRLGVNQEFSMMTLDYESKSYPDIIEYRTAVEIEKEILGFIE